MARSPWSWPLSWRIVILLNVSFYNLLGNAYAAGMPPLFALLIEEFHVSAQMASQTSTYVVLTLGLSNILALPLSALIGKRYTVLLSLVVFLSACIWSGEAASFSSLRASRLLGGLAGGLIEALGPRIVVETFPEHQLARAMVVYVGLLAAGSAVGPIVAGAIADGLQSWRWFMRVLSIAIFCNLVAAVIMLPETDHYGQLTGADGFLEDGDRSEDEDVTNKLETQVETLSQTDTGPQPQQQHRQAGVRDNSSHSLKREYIDRSWTASSVRLDWKGALQNIYQPFSLLLAPQVLVAVLVFGLTIGWTVVISIIVANVYAQPPVLFSALQVGLLSVGPLVGLILGLPVGGALADWLSARSRVRHDGEHRPASRLPAALLGAIVSPAGCVVVGYGLLDPRAHWFQVCAGWCMLSVGLTDSANVLLTYAVDCVPTRAGHVGTLLNLTKNLIAFGVSYASISWMESAGPVRQFGAMAGILFAAYLLVIPVGFYTKQIIKKTAWLS